MTRKLLRALAAVVVLTAACLTVWRVLRPAEVSEPARTAYPVAQALPAGVTGKLTMAPLIVGGRTRVYAGARLIKADGPVDAKTMYTPAWSYRRWPEQVAGVVAAGSTVVSRWSDGRLIALDSVTGKVLWQAGGPAVPAPPGRTGSDVVWAPAGLFVHGTDVLVADGRTVTAHAAADGAQRWSVAAGCGTGFVTAGGMLGCDSGVLDATTGTPVEGWPAGPFTPLGCDVASSGCAGLRDAAGRGWLTGTAAPVRAAALDRVTATAGGSLVLDSADAAVTASGAAAWRWEGNATVLGVRSGKVVLLGLTNIRQLITLDAGTGAQLAAFPLYGRKERQEPFEPHGWQLTDSRILIERLLPEATGDPAEPNHYYNLDAVIAAAF